jgi:hypothetical protein
MISAAWQGRALTLGVTTMKRRLQPPMQAFGWSVWYSGVT